MYPRITFFVTHGEGSLHRLINTRNYWKRAMVIDILYQLASAVKNGPEFERISFLCRSIDLEKDLSADLKDKRFWIVADATRKAARFKLGELVPLILQNLNSHEYELWTASARALTQMDKGVLLVQYLIDNEAGLEREWIIRMVDILLGAEEEVTTLIMNHLESVSPTLKPIFIEVLGKRREVNAISLIESYLTSEDKELRRKALKAIADIGITTREDTVIEILSEGEWTDQIACIRVIQECSLRSAVPRLVELMSDKNWWIRLRSGEVLYGMGSMGVEKLKWISNFHNDTYARDMALRILGEKEIEGVSLK